MTETLTRLDSEFTTVCAFWRPESPDDVYTGTLTADERRILFITAPQYSGTLSSMSPATVIGAGGGAPERLPVLHGFTEHALCTLCQLTEIAHPGRVDHALDRSIVATTYRALTCVIGMHIAGVDDRSLDSAQYSFSGLSQWLPSAMSEFWEKNEIVLRVPLEARDVVSFGIRENRTEVSLKLFSALTSSESERDRVMRSVPYVKIGSPEGQCLSWYRDLGNRLENVFSLLTGASLALETLFIYRGEESGQIIERRMSDRTSLDLRNCVRCSPGQLANAIAIWLSESQRLRSVENLALGVVRKGKLFFETEFLSLAQALEGFHRATTEPDCPTRVAFRPVRRKILKLLREEAVDDQLARRVCDSLSYVTDPSFAARLRELCGRISDSLLEGMEIDTERFVGEVVATRNFYTHAGGPRLRGKHTPLEGMKLFLVNQKMRALLRGIMLRRLEIPEGNFREPLIWDATRWR
jgi:ApeA N-terminal domain 1